MGADILTIWLALLTLMGGILPIIITGRQSRREKEADAKISDNKREVDHSAMLIEQLQEEVATLRRSRVEDAQTINDLLTDFRTLQRHVTAMETQIAEWEQGIKKLTDQIRDNGLEPIWAPATSTITEE